MKDVKFPLERNKTNITKIEDILKINICILTVDDNNNVYTMFTSENDHKNDLNLFNYKDHICLIKYINKYLNTRQTSDIEITKVLKLRTVSFAISIK